MSDTSPSDPATEPEAAPRPNCVGLTLRRVGEHLAGGRWENDGGLVENHEVCVAVCVSGCAIVAFLDCVVVLRVEVGGAG